MIVLLVQNVLIPLSWEHLSTTKFDEYAKNGKCKFVLIESYYEFEYHKHHKKKLVFFLSCMRHFYETIKAKYDIEYLKTNLSFAQATIEYAMKHNIDSIKLIRPGEYRIYDEMKAVCQAHKIEFELLEDQDFICSIDKFQKWASKYKGKLLMENFYRQIRIDTGLLMTDDAQPAVGQWNFDKENRNAIPGHVASPNLRNEELDHVTKEVVELVQNKFGSHFGDIHPFWLAVTRDDALQRFEDFVRQALQDFGKYQDAMKSEEELLFHSSISSYLNVGLLHPMEVCKAVEREYFEGRVGIESAEGFIRQILGWREFIRGIYWIKMPEYQHLNYLSYKTALPDFYWTAETDCECIKQVVLFTKKYAYSHHIQRLMVTGNFAALVGIEPEQICDWYLCVYSDAHEWVEMPNTLGMATFSDGGIVGTKPYVASGNYINKMSDFCKGCKYKYNKSDGPDACPFNYLYWNFLLKHQAQLRPNHRMRMMYSVVDKMSDEKQSQMRDSAERFIKKLRPGY